MHNMFIIHDRKRERPNIFKIYVNTLITKSVVNVVNVVNV